MGTCVLQGILEQLNLLLTTCTTGQVHTFSAINFERNNTDFQFILEIEIKSTIIKFQI